MSIKSSNQYYTDPNFVHIALATYPKDGNSIAYVKEVQEQIHQKFKRDLQNNYKKGSNLIDNSLYNPLVYHIFGTYDVAFISLINNDKFSQKLFGSFDFSESFNNSFQILTGMSPNLSETGELTLEGTFKDIITKNYPFVSICNLKLSNGLLIGNGYDYLQKVMCTIAETIKKNYPNVHFLIVQSFSWYEINLVLFAETCDILAQIITTLRAKKVSELAPHIKIKTKSVEEIIKNSLYFARIRTNIPDNEKIELVRETHLFSDTHSHIGIRYDLMMGEFPSKLPPLNTQIEFQIKPGHYENVIQELQKLDSIFDIKNSSYVMGKSDYIIPEQEPNSIKNNHILFQKLYNSSDRNFNLRPHIRNFKTRPYFNNSLETGQLAQVIDDLPKSLRELEYTPIKLKTIDEILKKLKTSRQIREKVLKMYFNFNNGISDSVMYTYFVDFVVFMERLTEYIEDQSKNFIKNFEEVSVDFSSVNEIEEVLRHYIDAFDEGYWIRVMNSFEFEDIYDFDLDFNSSTQQLLSTYNMILQKASQLYYTRPKGHLVRLHSQNTVGNDISINYNVYHLTSPEFVFFTLGKEILNSQSHINQGKEEIKQGFKETIGKISEILKRKSESNPTLKSWLKDGILDASYLLNNVYRYIYTCNYNFKLFEFWVWQFAFQNTALYSSMGLIKEKYFRNKLIDILALRQLIFDTENTEIECPTAEVYIYWERYFYEYKALIEEIFSDSEIANAIMDHLHSSLDVVKFESKIFFKHGYYNGGLRDSYDSYLSLLSIESNINEGIQPLFDNRGRKEIFERAVEKIIEKIRQGEPILYSSTFKGTSEAINDNLFLHALVYSYLLTIFKDKKGKINLLRRDWQTGNPLKGFISCNDKNGLYTIDPFGGIFLICPENTKKYFKIRNAILQSIWHFSLIIKKEFILNTLGIKPTNEQ